MAHYYTSFAKALALCAVAGHCHAGAGKCTGAIEVEGLQRWRWKTKQQVEVAQRTQSTFE